MDAFLADERFTQIFEGPDANGQSLRISYADYGYRNEEDPEQENVFLFFSPLIGSRMMHVAKDSIARTHKVRIINADRPGFDSMTPDVEPAQRLAKWRGKLLSTYSFFHLISLTTMRCNRTLRYPIEAILALLHHMQIRYVSLGAQSAGAVYALDLLLHHPEVLHPEQGYLAIGAPWIHPAHSGIWHLSMAQALPTSVLAHSDKLASYFTIVSVPVIGKSLDLVSSMLQWLGSKPERDGGATVMDADVGAGDGETAFAEALDPKLADYIFDDSVLGMSNETILLLQRPNSNRDISGWADWGDYDALVPQLRQALADKDRRLAVDVFLSETDSMTGDPGTAGPEWFIRYWETTASNNPITFSSSVVPGSDHNSIWATRWGVARGVFERMKRFSSLHDGHVRE